MWQAGRTTTRSGPAPCPQCRAPSTRPVSHTPCHHVAQAPLQRHPADGRWMLLNFQQWSASQIQAATRPRFLCRPDTTRMLPSLQVSAVEQNRSSTQFHRLHAMKKITSGHGAGPGSAAAARDVTDHCRGCRRSIPYHLKRKLTPTGKSALGKRAKTFRNLVCTCPGLGVRPWARKSVAR